MSTIVVVAPLKYGAYAEAKALVDTGPPFDPERTPLVRHDVYLTGNEAVFLFEGAEARLAVQDLIGDASIWASALAWRRLLAGRPRVAELAYAWSREPVVVPERALAARLDAAVEPALVGGSD
jgi:hypothetical protein